MYGIDVIKTTLNVFHKKHLYEYVRTEIVAYLLFKCE